MSSLKNQLQPNPLENIGATAPSQKVHLPMRDMNVNMQQVNIVSWAHKVKDNCLFVPMVIALKSGCQDRVKRAGTLLVL